MAPARVPDGHRPARALEAGRAARPVRRGCAGRSRSRRHGAARCRSRSGDWIAADRASACCSRSGSSRRPSSASARARSRALARGGLLARSSRAQPRGYYGMLLAHLGVAVFIVGVTLVKGYETERDVRMDVGDTRRRSAATRSASTASTRVTGPELPRAARHVSRSAATARSIETLHPEKRVYNAQQHADDRGGDRHRLHSATSMSRWRAGRRRRRLERARLPQAVRRLDLGRLRADGARRLARAERPALPRRARQRAATRCAGAAGARAERCTSMNRFLIPLGDLRRAGRRSSPSA